MGVTVDSNRDEVEAVYDELQLEDHRLEVANVMEYALYLHYRDGYFVFNNEMLRRIVKQKIESFAEDAGGLSDAVIEGALQTAAAEYVNWLLDVVGETQPPISPSQTPAVYAPGEIREALRGGWAAVTGQLSAGFRSRVDEGDVMSHEDAAPAPVRITEELRLDYP